MYRKSELVGVRKQFSFLPPFDYRHLSGQKKEVVNYLKIIIIHFLTTVNYKCKVYTILKNLTNTKCIDVNVSERKKVLENEVNTNIIDFERLNCPPLCVLRRRSSFALDYPLCIMVEIMQSK